MPTFKNGELTVSIEVGSTYRGWNVLRIDHVEPNATFGTHSFRFSREGKIVAVTNTSGSGSESHCFSLASGWFEKCPDELLFFTSRNTKLVNDTTTTANAVRTGD